MKQMKFARVGISTAALIFIVGLAGCGENPQSLAKQTYEISQQLLAARLDPSKTAELIKKSTDIQYKVAKLSEKDRAVYNAELVRLGGGALGDLLDAASKLQNDVSAEDIQKTLDTANKALDTADKALDTANKATDALKSLGF